jgi:hypothetical protein
MVDGFLDRLPLLILAVAVFFAFYGLSRFAAALDQEGPDTRQRSAA